MRREKNNTIRRLLAAILSAVMVLSVMPLTIVSMAASDAHPNAVTITVIDDATEEPIEDAKVSFKIFDNDLGDEVIGSDDVPTDANGTVEVLDSEPGNVKLSYVSVTHDDYEAYTNATYNQPITGLDNNFVIRLTCKIIKDVQIEGKALTYNGDEQELVSVTKVDGDTVLYELDGGAATSTPPKKTNVGTYNIKVTVQRTGKDDLVKEVTATIGAADITDIDIAAKAELKYNGTEQELVELVGLKDGDNVTWSVNGTTEVSQDVPKRMAVGNYKVRLTVDRGANYNKFEKTVDVDIALGEIDLGDLIIEANDRTYDTTEQPLLKESNVGEYTLKYSDDNKTTWKNDIPKAADAGEYLVYVKAVKDNYEDKNTEYFPITVTIAKANQEIAFGENVPSSITLGTVSEYDFAASGYNLSGNEIEYSLVNCTSPNVASITTDGKLTVKQTGVVTVKAFRQGNKNYNDAEAFWTVVIKKGGNKLVSFDSDKENCVLNANGVVSEKAATKAKSDDNGTLKYSIDNTNIGLNIDENTGEVTVSNFTTLTNSMKKAKGEVSVKVTVNKGEGTIKAKVHKFLFIWSEEERVVYDAASASYILTVSFLAAPESPFSLSETAGENGWYKTDVTVNPADGFSIAKTEVNEKADNFSTSAVFDDQGTDDRYIYLKNNATGEITDRLVIAGVKIDTVTPDAKKIEIEYQTQPIAKLLEKITFGFYKSDVKVKFTAYDETSGVEYFTWNYTKEQGASAVNHPASIADTKIPAKSEQDEKNAKYTATVTLTADEAKQYRGYLSVSATDKAGNTSDIKADTGNVFVLDTVSPDLNIKYSGKDEKTVEKNFIGNKHYFNGDVIVEITVTEANFYADDVKISVTKNGEAFDFGFVNWGKRDEKDRTVGTFTLAGDGDYIVYVSYSDKSGNSMDDYVSDIITVDKTAPVVKIDYEHKGDVQKTVFTVTEHNFRASDVVITGTMKDINGTDISFTATQLTEILNNATWTRNGDMYTYKYDQYVNGIYNLKMDYKDISGWDATQFVANEFIIDHGAPTEPTVEYITTPWDTFLSVITFGYYNPSVTVRFTSYDTVSGVESFTWGYTKQKGASNINHPDALDDATVPAVQDQNDKSKFTAEITMTADEAAQYRGYISVFATDDFQNNSVKKTDDGNIIVVDTVAPEMSVEYTAPNRTVGNEYFYNKDVDVKLTVTEANFYADDVKISVTKNGEAFDFGSVNWGERDEKDRTVGTFTLPASDDHSGDGHYVITVEYTDRSNNEMVKYVSDTHTVDTTKPVINVEYQNKTIVNKLADRDGNERNYYADTQTAIVTITEHNFIADEVDFTIVAKDVTGAELDATALNTKSEWKVDSTGDVHTITITYPGDANYTFDVAYTDKATNAADDYAPDYFTVDKTAPANLKVNYSTSVLDTVLESLTFGFYNAKMTVTLTAEDPTSEVHSFLYSYLNAAGVSNVNAQLINEAIKAADIKYSENRKTATVTFEIPKMVLGNDNQFNGTVEFTATDRAGNETEVHKETKRIVVDNIAPTAQVSYNAAVNTVGDISYYNGDINATVTVKEANFYAEDISVTVTKDGGAASVVTPVWKDNGDDVHVGTFTLTGDGDYTVTVNYTDKSSNKMATYTSKQMTIDTQIEAPTFSINGVSKTEDGGAYKKDVTVSFGFEDRNYDTKTIKLERTRFNTVEDVTAKFIRSSDTDKGGSGSFEIPSETDNDGIYVLTIGITDKAKHTVDAKLKFTVNRFGSVYEYGDYLVTLLDKQFIKNDGDNSEAITDDLVITEYNANQILANSLNILITRDGETIDTKYTADPVPGGNAAIDGGGWYRYEYKIAKENFAEDGVYKITLTSAYAASDSEKNDSTSVPENSIDKDGNKILSTMNFTVDTTKPEIRNIVNLDKPIVNAQSLDVSYTVVDVGGLKSVEVIVNGVTLETITNFGDSTYNYSGSFTLNESSYAQTVQLKATDFAGNVTDTSAEDFDTNDLYELNQTITVSTNFFVRWYANKLVFWGSVGGAVVLIAAVWFIVAFKRKKKNCKTAK